MKYLVAFAVVLSGLGTAWAAEPAPAPVSPAPWDKDLLETFSVLPIQDEGRIKPLDTYAQFSLLRLNGKRSFTTEDGRRLTPMAWLLDCLFYPEAAKNYAHFIVDSAEAVQAIGGIAHAEKRSRYSYNELLPYREKLMELADTYSAIEASKRARIHQQVINLADNITLFEKLAGFFDFARETFMFSGDTEIAKAFPEKEGVHLGVILERLPAVLKSLKEKSSSMEDAVLQKETGTLHDVMKRLENVVDRAHELAMIPPQDPAMKAWWSPADVITAALDFTQQEKPPMELYGALENLATTCRDRAAFSANAHKFYETVVAHAKARGEYSTIPMEVSFYRTKYFFYSQWLFVLSFIVVAFSWLMPRRKWLYRISPLAVLVPTAFLIVGISMRCIIRGRPPVTTLYETILFTTAVIVLVSLVIEWLNKQRFAVAFASIFGMLGLFIAYRYEVKESVDTMPSMVAVLDTNFWLSTHVTTIVVGYGAGMLAGALAHLYILGRIFRFREKAPEFYEQLARTIYGVVCFCLLFSIVGTVLGGIWANESWGRFWGWDPKENGALMIVLWTLAITHARRGGYIGRLGIAISAIILDMIVTFSWWGVNLLGVGLHSYGFTAGIMNTLALFWILESCVILAGVWVWRRGLSQDLLADSE